ncbi:hypothetical protein OH77DRAFT_1413304 [Trametes cingulata]|nr:hypothetical protein OH77DRAFT_1413304 [Trametes cingulata]
MEKPRISLASRIFRADTDKRQGAPRGKKTLPRDLGKLREIMNMPLDVFIEIAAHLRPIDILQLARTSKLLRNILLSHGSRSVWITARKAIEPPLPECPHGVSEPQYASVVFERFCHACGVGRAVNVDYSIPIRLCGPCWKANVRNALTLAQEAGLNDEQAEIFGLLPQCKVARSGSHASVIDSLDQTPAMADKMAFYEPEFVAVAKQYKELRVGKDTLALQRFTDERKADTLRRLNFSLAVAKWASDMRRGECEARVESQKRQEQRQADVEAKLIASGYPRESWPTGDLEFRKIMHAPRPRKLTPQTWNEILPHVLEAMDRQRALRADWERRARQAQLAGRYAAFLDADRNVDAQKRTLPAFPDALPFMQDVNTDLCGVDVADAQFTAAVEAVLAHADEYRARVRHDLAQIVREAQAAASAGPSSGTRTRAREGSRDKSKGTGKQRARPVDDPVERALLDAPTSLFCCHWSCSRGRGCTARKTFAGMLEHWQREHGASPWEPEDVLLVPDPEGALAAAVGRLAGALGLPEDAGLSAIEEEIWRGGLECACGEDPDVDFARGARYLLLDELVRLPTALRLPALAHSGLSCSADARRNGG